MFESFESKMKIMHLTLGSVLPLESLIMHLKAGKVTVRPVKKHQIEPGSNQYQHKQDLNICISEENIVLLFTVLHPPS